MLLLLCGVSSVDPFRVYINGFGKVVYFALVPLIAYSTHELGYAFFPVYSDGNRLVMVAKQASERSIQRNLLSSGGWFPRRLFSLAHDG